MPLRIDDLGLGGLPVDSVQDRALAGLLCAGNGVRSKPGESGRCWDGSGTGSGCRGVVSPIVRIQDVVRMSSGCRQDASGCVRGSIWCAGACAVISGVIVSPAVISGPAIGCVNSFPFVRWFWFWWWLVGGCDDMDCRYGATIWCDDMHCRYGATICKA